jgi:hypothetical protein
MSCLSTCGELSSRTGRRDLGQTLSSVLYPRVLLPERRALEYIQTGQLSELALAVDYI